MPPLLTEGCVTGFDGEIYTPASGGEAKGEHQHCFRQKHGRHYPARLQVVLLFGSGRCASPMQEAASFARDVYVTQVVEV